MSLQPSSSRRAMLKAVGAGIVGAMSSPQSRAESALQESSKTRSNIKQSVCRWCFGKVPLAQLASEAARIGYKSVELLEPEEYKTIKPYGLTCAMVRCASISEGLNRKENHDRIEKELRKHIDFAAAEGIPNVICMAGNRRGMSDEEGLENCAIGLKRAIGLAEQKKVTICMEGLNSKIDHKDYMYDFTS